MDYVLFEYSDGHKSLDFVENLGKLKPSVIAFTVLGVQYRIGVPIIKKNNSYVALSNEQLEECINDDICIVYYQQGQYKEMPMDSNIFLVDSFAELENIYSNLIAMDSNLVR